MSQPVTFLRNKLYRWGLTPNILRTISVVLISLLLCLIASGSVQAQESASQRVQALRDRLSQVELRYAEDIGNQSSASSEARLALLRAEQQTTLDAIKAYEVNLAAGSGEATTFWNVLSTSDLKKSQTLAKLQLDLLKVERLKWPPDSVPLKLEFSIRELESWANCLDGEINRRNGNPQVKLKPIRGDLSVDEARLKFPAIDAIDGSGKDLHFQREVAFQAEFRSHNSPDDTSLAFLRNNLPKTPDPPGYNPNIERGPPDSFESAQRRLKIAQLEEIKAVGLGDYDRVATLRAEEVNLAEWLNIAIGRKPGNDQFGFSATDTDHVMRMRDHWNERLSSLIIEQNAQPNGRVVRSDIDYAKNRVRVLDAILEDRLLPRPPPGNEWNPDFDPGNSTPKPGKGTSAFAKNWDRDVAHVKTDELMRTYNQYSPTGNPQIKADLIKSVNDGITADAKSLHQAYQDSLKLQKTLLVEGRGLEASKAGKEVLRARKQIQANAAEMLEYLNHPNLSHDPEIQSARALLQTFARRQTSGSAESSFGQTLTDLENANETVKTVTQTRSMEIQSITPGELSPDSQHRIPLERKMALPDPNPRIPPPAEFNDRYPKGKTPTSLPEILKDPRRAPGGIIVDTSLPEELTRRIKKLDVNVENGAIQAEIDGSPHPLQATSDPVLIRIAWAFVIDGRTALIDLRPLDPPEVIWLYSKYSDKRLSKTARAEVINELGNLTSVTVNEAVRDSSLVSQLISADQLMFYLLPANTILLEGEKSKYGLPLDELRRAYRADAGAELNRRGWETGIFKKSIIDISRVNYKVDEKLTILPQLSFHLFDVPAEGDGIIPLTESERWFAKYQEDLRKLPVLSRLSDFAALVAIFRSVYDHNIPNNLDDLVSVTIPSGEAPRFIVRRDRISSEHWRRLADSLSNKDK